MSKLILDVGNSRIKVAVIDGEYQYLGAISFEDFLSPVSLNAFIDSLVPESIYISCVASLMMLEKIKSMLQTSYKLFPVILTSQQACCGLTSGYEDPHQLGVDRWMALQGANSLYRQPCIVIDAGTAMTIDALVEGQHLGGFIVPGLSSLRKSLEIDTANIVSVENIPRDETQIKESALLANNTRSAILGGTLYMTASFINSIVFDLNQQVGTKFKILLTGGNASKLVSLIDGPTEFIPDLVLLGMKEMIESVKK